MKSQKQKILGWLQEHPNGICSTDLLRVRISRGAARISELRTDGYKIDTVTCHEHGHRTRQIRYVLQPDRSSKENYVADWLANLGSHDEWEVAPGDEQKTQQLSTTYDPEHGA